MAAFPTSIGTIQKDPAVAWQMLKGLAGQVKQSAIDLNAASLAGNVGGQTIVQFLTNLAVVKATMDSYAATPGLQAYAQAQSNGTTTDIVADYNTMVAQINACGSWIMTNFPKDSTNTYLAYQSFDGAGNLVYRQFSTATLATFRTQLQALIATMN